jgi:hypothetical protein
MVRFLLTHPELNDDIKFDKKIYDEDFYFKEPKKRVI